MRRSKSIIFIVLTLLPVSLLLITLVHGLLADQPLSISSFSFGSISVSYIESGVSVSFIQDTISGSVLSSFFSSGAFFPSGTVCYAFFRALDLVSISFGFPQIPAVLFVSVLYFLYWASLYFISVLTDLILLPFKLIERFLP